MQAIERSFSILNTIAAHPKGLSLSEISQSLGLAKSTTSRFLQSLENVNAISKTANKYQIAMGIINLAHSVPSAHFLKVIAYPSLLELADKSRETVHLAIQEQYQVKYIEQINTPHRVQLETWLNKAYPLHVTAAGKLFLAYASHDFLESYLAKPLKAFSSKSLTDPTLLRAELARIKAQGYAETKQEFSEDINGFAVAIFDEQFKPMASISISGPHFRFPKNDTKKLISLLLDASEQLSKKSLKEERLIAAP